MAEIAASAPLLPDLTPALWTAWSTLSVVTTPNITGFSLSRPTEATPLDTSAQT